MTRPSRGVVLVALLLAMLLAEVVALLGAESWSNARKREREAELLYVGDQYRLAIKRYFYGAPPGQLHVLPPSLDELVQDHRYPVPIHHLRRLYPDPITDSPDWGLAMSGDRIAGVYSRSEDAPLKQTGFPIGDAAFEKSATYQSWLFIFVPPPSRKR